MGTKEIQEELAKITKMVKESEELRRDIKELNKMSQDLLWERISKLEAVMLEFCEEADVKMMNPWAGVYYKKFKELLDKK